ncbi:hypothetical protein BEL04_18470 [Mucilaginibacter sp. PPCGB 2223]|uniref:YcxB family protein n=1 Tax=Mucilaginibacter sp. PPCGB 2223 TaxID=1886027 RepID=UPI0008262088|nr:YcxB family protein [Mucilaginibacter sp. PPCGB 2223]OCX50724.1 hypothetical protein BEL04_18470 [Mucilaginibacter sp. PPCGB 2223]
MQPLILNTQLGFKPYYNVNLYMLLRRKVIWFMLLLIIVMIVLSIISRDGDHTYTYLAIFYTLFTLTFPLLIYFSAKRQYKKITAMHEPKSYEFSAEGIKLTGETIRMETGWVNINKAIKRKADFILFSSNSRNFFYLPMADFENEQSLNQFENLVKEKVAKRNF